MKVLVTGMTSRATSMKRELGFPGLIARTIAEMDHDVTMHVEYSGTDRYDAVIAAIASPLAPSSRYLVPTAQTIDEADRQGKLAAVLLDDPDVDKIAHACSSVLRMPDRLERPFFMQRPGMAALVGNGSIRRTTMALVERMASWSWSTVVWPGHPWAVDQVSGRGDGGFLSAPIDPTITLASLIIVRLAAAARSSRGLLGGAWVAETTYFSDYGFDPSVERPVYAVSLGDSTLLNTVAMISNGYGMIHGNKASPGWWTPNVCLALVTDRILVPHPDEGRLMGEPYYAMPSAMEDLGDDYEAAVAAQRQQFEETTWTKSRLHAVLNGVLGRAGS